MQISMQVDMVLPVDQLLNKGRLNKLKSAILAAKSRIFFDVDKKNFDELPEEPSVYMLIWRPEFSIDFYQDEFIGFNYVVYVGDTENIKNECLNGELADFNSNMAVHFDESQKENIFLRVKNFSNLICYCIIDEKENLNLLKEQLLSVFCPPGNKQKIIYSASYGKTEKAF